MRIKPPREVDYSEPVPMRINLNRFRFRSEFSHLRQLTSTQCALMRIHFASVEGPLDSDDGHCFFAVMLVKASCVAIFNIAAFSIAIIIVK